MICGTPNVRVGAFRCVAEHPLWQRENQITSGHIIVFPRTAVQITQAGAAPVVAGPNIVMCYNRSTAYRRELISARGDECEWFAIDDALLCDALAAHDPAVRDRPERPFAFPCCPSDSQSYLLQRRLFECCRRGALDPLEIDEIFFEVLARVARNAYRAWPPDERRRRNETVRIHRRAAEGAKRFIAVHFAEPLRLEQIADAVGTSVYHLSRVFHRHAGLPMHRYITQLRLHSSLEHLLESDAREVDIALRLGFASEAHFSDRFRRTFGLPPSAFRRGMRSRQMSKIVKAPGASLC